MATNGHANQHPATTNAAQQGGAVSTGETKTLEQQAISRLAACRTWKSYIELDIKECYFFTAPNRQRQISSMVMPSQARMLDAPELNTDQAFILTQDFITAIINAYMPEAEPWCERTRGMFVAPRVWDQIKDRVRTDDKLIFEAIRASNFYPEVAKAFYPDLAICVAAVWIARPHPAMPITVSAVPIRELEIDLGPYGEIDTRFAVRYTRNHYVRELVGEEIWAKMDPQLRERADNSPSDRTQVIWGFWRDWDDKSDECWQHVVLFHNRLIHDCILKGEGACPLIVTRFNPTADWPHAHGPMYMGLPTFRQIDELEQMRIEHATLSFKPPITYPDDSFAAVETGVEEGMAYPIRPGSENAVKPIYTPPSPQVANYQYEEKLKDLRKLFFVDHPEQTGDTPPTATQWMDELARAQRRLGTPGMSFWREGPAAYFLRYKHLLELAGVIAPLKVDGRAVATLPRNPAQAAAEQQDIVKTMQLATYLAQTFPEEFKMYVDGAKTMKELLDKARVTLIKMRDPAQVQATVEQMSKILQPRPVGAQPGGPPVIGPAA
jgi:hypothetical protein